MRYPDKIKKRSHVVAMKWHRFPINEERRQERIAMISKARKNFIDGEPTTRYPNPSLFLTRHDELQATLKREGYQQSIKLKM